MFIRHGSAKILVNVSGSSLVGVATDKASVVIKNAPENTVIKTKYPDALVEMIWQALEQGKHTLWIKEKDIEKYAKNILYKNADEN